MKLGSCYVKYKGKFVQIVNVDIDEEAYAKANINYRFPEDSLPFIRFYISPKKHINYNDFEISFPKDKYIRYNNKQSCYWVERRMSRTYKLAPSEEHYAIPAGVRMNLNKFLNLSDEKFDSIDSLFKFPSKDLLLANNVIATNDSDTKKKIIKYKGVEIARLLFKEGHLILKATYRQDRIPNYISKMFAKYWDIKFPFKAPPIEDKPKPKSKGESWEGRFRWQIYDNMTQFMASSNWSIFLERNIAPRVKYRTNVYNLGSPTQRRMLNENVVIRTVLRDINQILNDYDFRNYTIPL